jgi:hypothetical protein
VAVATRYKYASLDSVTTMATLLRRHVPEVGDEAFILCGGIIAVASAVWPLSRPSPSVLAAYEADPALAVLRIDFTTALQYALATLIAGTIARATPAGQGG